MPPFDTDEKIRGYCKVAGNTLYHAVGTCRMGHGPDAVVDPQLRVIGIKGSRCRCVDHAEDFFGQYQRADDHDRGKSIRHDPGEGPSRLKSRVSPAFGANGGQAIVPDPWRTRALTAMPKLPVLL